MPLFRLVLPSPGVKVGFWKITETAEELQQMYHTSAEETGEIAKLPDLRRSHFLASRILARYFFPDGVIEKDSFGKPHIANSQHHISWSHSGNFAAFIADKNGSTGIDIETISPKILRLEDKFCNRADKQCIHTTHHALSLLMIWSAKESMYKWYGAKEVDFRKEMTISPFELHDEGRFIAGFHKDEIKQEFIMEYQLMEGHLAVWIVNTITE